MPPKYLVNEWISEWMLGIEGKSNCDEQCIKKEMFPNSKLDLRTKREGL